MGGWLVHVGIKPDRPEWASHPPHHRDNRGSRRGCVTLPSRKSTHDPVLALADQSPEPRRSGVGTEPTLCRGHRLGADLQRWERRLDELLRLLAVAAGPDLVDHLEILRR